MNIVQKLKEKYNLSIWLDYLDKEIIETLPSWVRERKIYGITTNPTIFNSAINRFPEKYFENVKSFDFLEVIEDLMVDDVKKACEIMLPIFEETEHQDGLVSIEVPPYIAYNVDKTIEKAKELWQKISMPNVMIKVPATNEGIQAITQLYKSNININVTLLFSIRNYQRVIEAYKEAGGNSISVASFFVSRVDTVIDGLILKMKDSGIISEEYYNDLVGKVAVANSLLAYEIYEKNFSEQKKIQRILWASTSTKNPSYNPLKYVIELLTINSINTIPLNTYQTLMQTEVDLEKVEKIVEKNRQEAQKIINKLSNYVNFDYILEELLYKGVSLFSDSYNSIIDSVITNFKLVKKQVR